MGGSGISFHFDDIPVFQQSLSDKLPSKVEGVFGLEDQRYCCGLWIFLIKCWRSPKLIKESTFESSASTLLYPLAESFFHEDIFLLNKLMCQDGCWFCIADYLIPKETVENGLMA